MPGVNSCRLQRGKGCSTKEKNLHSDGAELPVDEQTPPHLPGQAAPGVSPIPVVLLGSITCHNLWIRENSAHKYLLLTQGLHQPCCKELKFFTISAQLKMFHLESLGADVCTSWDKEIKQGVNDYVLHWDMQCPKAKLDKF